MKKQLVPYLVQRVGVQTVLVIGIVAFGFLFVEELVARVDLTEDQRFTISEASHRLARSLEDPLTIRAYFSSKLPETAEPIQRQVFDILAEYEAASGGKITLERYDPDQSVAARGEAENYGIQPVPLGVYAATEQKTVQVYGSVVLLYRDRASERIDIARRYPEGYEGLSALEYELTSRIWQLVNERPKLGLTGYLNSDPAGNPLMGPRGQQPQPKFQILRRVLGESFEIEELDLKQTEPDPAKMPLLLVVRPREFSDVEVFRLDQYLMKGGRVLMFITEGEISVQPWGDGYFGYKPFKTGLDEWLAHHGLRVPNEFVLHLYRCRQIPKEFKQGRLTFVQGINNWFWPIVSAEADPEALDQDNPAIQTLDAIAFYWPHPVDVLEDNLADGTKATVLVRSHKEESWRWKDQAHVDVRAFDPQTEGPTTTSSSPLAVSLEGRFTSFYADRPPPPSLGLGGGAEEKEEGAEEPADDSGVLKESVEPSHLVVVGNSIFVSDDLLGAQRDDDLVKQVTLLASNLADWLARSKELIALRAKRYAKRQIVDEELSSDFKEIREKYSQGELSLEEANLESDRALERQRDRRDWWRWANVLFPALFISVSGALIWILRAAWRSGKSAPPAPVPPADLQ